jgi:hypothetical protein
MGIMYAMKCDMCGEVQVHEQAHQLKGRTYQENGTTKFSCTPCDGKLKAALALGKDGLDDPLKHVGRLLEQKDQEVRNLELRASAKAGDMMGVADELRRKRETGGVMPVLGLDFESQYRAAKGISTTGHPNLPALPAPQEPKNKKKKDKK